MPRKRKAPVQEFRFAAWRGVPCFDFNMCLMLAHAPMEQAIEAFVKTFDAKRTRDVIGRDIAHRPPAYLAYQFKGHPWTVFDQFLLALDTRWTTEEQARRFSRTLADKVLLFPISDTAGVYQYTMYDKGKLFERVFNENEADSFKPYRQGFESPGRKIKPPRPADLLKFIDQFMREQDILIPPFGSIAGSYGSLTRPRAREKIHIDWGDEFNPENVERADYLSLA